MDPTKALEVQSVSEAYFMSLNDRTNKLHIIESKNAEPEEISTDVRVWYAGFTACAKLLGINTQQLPILESLLGVITKNFPDKARIAA